MPFEIRVGDMPESGYAIGCDVSVYQDPASIDWTARTGAAAEDGLGWAMVRSGYGAHPDRRFAAHWQNAAESALSVGAYHFVTEDSPEEQIDCMLSQLRAVGCGSDNIAPALDLEWLPDPQRPGGRLPYDHAAYCLAVDRMLDALDSEYGGAWIYSCVGFWRAVGAPKRWLGYEWWVPWYPRPGFTSDDARRSKWPARPGEPTPAAWQYGCPTAKWAGGAMIDRNIARRLPMIVQV